MDKSKAVICSGYPGKMCTHVHGTGRGMVCPLAIRAEKEGLVFEGAEQYLALHDEAEQKLRFSAEHNQMTGTLRQSVFAERTRDIIRSRRHEDQASVLAVIDIDGLKPINDHYGHTSGDLIIIALARLLRENTRSEDLVGRIGGDEFGVFFPRTSLVVARAIMKRVRKGFEAHEFPFLRDGGSPIVHPSFSFGLADLDECALRGRVTYRTLFKLADKRMYVEKIARKQRSHGTQDALCA